LNLTNEFQPISPNRTAADSNPAIHVFSLPRSEAWIAATSQDQPGDDALGASASEVVIGFKPDDNY